MRTATLALLTAASIVAAGCVIRTHHTIEAHVTVDIRHVEEQADSIVSYITGESDALPPAAATPAPAPEEETSWLMRAVDFVAPVQVAYAAELKESSPKVRELAERLRQRNGEVRKLKTAGCVGEDNRGYLQLRPCEELDDPARKNEVQQILAAVNKDRKDLYRAVAELNRDQNVTLSVVEAVFAGKWREQSQAGDQIQLPAAGPEFDAFMKTALGKKLGAAAKPGEWVVVK